MSELKRLPLKYIRDFIKKDYKIRDCCYVCAITTNLELHHLYSVSELFNTWCTKNKIRSIDTEEQILEYRVTFAKEYEDLLSHINLFTLCGKHHKQLHSIYGQRYSNNMAPKIKNWLELQREKHDN